MGYVVRRWTKPIKKTNLAPAVVVEKRWPVSTVAEAMQVSGSNLHDRLNGKARKRGRYKMREDRELAADISRLVDVRPTYGYSRIAGLLNKGRRGRGLLPVNHKRVFRIMAINGWLLTKYTVRPQRRIHDGRVIVMHSNLRRRSDAFELTCWNQDKVRVVFVIDAFDREIIGRDADGLRGVSGDMVRNLMLQAVEKRFGTLKTPSLLEFLTDNGSCYTAKETRDFVAALGLKPCFTPVRSPQSNGMAESFVKTFKRDCTLRSIPCRMQQRCYSHSAGGSKITMKTALIAGSNGNLPETSSRLKSETRQTVRRNGGNSRWLKKP